MSEEQTPVAQVTMYTAKDVKISPKQLDGVVTQIQILDATMVYKKTMDKDHKVVVVSVQNAEYNVDFNENMAQYPVGVIPDGSKLGKYLLRYKELVLGQTVKVVKNANNFWCVDY